MIPETGKEFPDHTGEWVSKRKGVVRKTGEDSVDATEKRNFQLKLYGDSSIRPLEFQSVHRARCL